MGDSHKSKSEMRTLVTEAFRQHHESVFGDVKPARGKWVWDRERRELVPAHEYVAPESGPGRTMVVSDLYMDGARATDGTDIGSRRKRREYMRENGLADADDYKQSWQKASAERAAALRGDVDPRQ